MTTAQVLLTIVLVICTIISIAKPLKKLFGILFRLFLVICMFICIPKIIIRAVGLKEFILGIGHDDTDYNETFYD